MHATRDPFPAKTHDHDHCVARALGRAEAICAARGRRLTAMRRRVLELVWASHAPIGAYQILERLALERGKVAPPTVYRALEFLSREGLVHRIDTRNAFVGCSAPSAPHHAFFLICRCCGHVAEFEDRALARSLDRCVSLAAFAPEQRVVELTGLCADCRRPA